MVAFDISNIMSCQEIQYVIGKILKLYDVNRVIEAVGDIFI